MELPAGVGGHHVEPQSQEGRVHQAGEQVGQRRDVVDQPVTLPGRRHARGVANRGNGGPRLRGSKDDAGGGQASRVEPVDPGPETGHGAAPPDRRGGLRPVDRPESPGRVGDHEGGGRRRRPSGTPGGQAGLPRRSGHGWARSKRMTRLGRLQQGRFRACPMGD